MNAKELRQAAEWLHKIRLACSNHTCTLIDYVLATVRGDDDELIDELWFIKQKRVDGPLRMIVLVRRPEGFHLEVNGYESDRPATRGDFRTLCRSLGVKLEEVSW